jgi:hypothetical protein
MTSHSDHIFVTLELPFKEAQLIKALAGNLNQRTTDADILEVGTAVWGALGGLGLGQYGDAGYPAVEGFTTVHKF